MTPTLYILMREDLPDMNPGKAMAQAAHAQADFDAWVDTLSPNDQMLWRIQEWKEDRTFGRTLVLSADLQFIESMMNKAGWFGVGMTVDPTYPWRNFYGKVFTTVEVTCAWCFACDLTPPDQIEFLKSLPLHQ